MIVKSDIYTYRKKSQGVKLYTRHLHSFIKTQKLVDSNNNNCNKSFFKIIIFFQKALETEI